MPDIFDEIASRVSSGGVIAIEGRCGSGKTTLAAALAEKLGGRVVHMDHFFLPPTLRSAQRLAQPGGNIDCERFLAEAAPCLRSNEFCYDAFDCSSNSLHRVSLPPSRVTIVEGSYCMHPSLSHLYDLKIYIDITPSLQRERIIAREGDRAEVFFSKWIPLEEKYLSAFDIAKKCDLIIQAGEYHA